MGGPPCQGVSGHNRHGARINILEDSRYDTQMFGRVLLSGHHRIDQVLTLAFLQGATLHQLHACLPSTVHEMMCQLYSSG